MTFRKPGDNLEPIDGPFEAFCGTGLDISDEAYAAYCKSGGGGTPGWKPWPLQTWRSVLVWQRYASPVWMDIDQTRTLQNKRHNPGAGDERDARDEQHISPLQLDVIERCIDLWSAPGDVVLTPFLGIGSEVYGAITMGRRGIGFELKPSYFAVAKKNLARATARAGAAPEADLLAEAAE